MTMIGIDKYELPEEPVECPDCGSLFDEQGNVLEGDCCERCELGFEDERGR